MSNIPNRQPSIRISCCSLPLLIGITGAVCTSWYFNHSVFWAIVHGCLNWFYLAYKTIWYVVTNF
jgi:hypothetical protein